MNNTDMRPDGTYTTLDGKPLAHPQSGITVVHHGGGITSVLKLDGVLIGPPPSFPGAR
jgi:hypothetical protein